MKAAVLGISRRRQAHRRHRRQVVLLAAITVSTDSLGELAEPYRRGLPPSAAAPVEVGVVLGLSFSTPAALVVLVDIPAAAVAVAAAGST